MLALLLDSYILLGVSSLLLFLVVTDFHSSVCNLSGSFCANSRHPQVESSETFSHLCDNTVKSTDPKTPSRAKKSPVSFLRVKMIFFSYNYMLCKLNTNFGEILMLVATQSSTFEKSILKASPQLAFVDLSFVEIKKWKHLLGSMEEWPTLPLLAKCSLKKNLWKVRWLFSTWKTLGKNRHFT